MKPKTLEVTVGGVRLRVPIYRDEKTTLAVVQVVNDRFKEIESQGGKINTQQFALLAACSFAAELALANDITQATDQELLRALDKVQSTLTATLAELAPPSD